MFIRRDCILMESLPKKYFPQIWTVLNVLFTIISFFHISQAGQARENHVDPNQNKLFLNEFAVHVDGNHRLATHIAHKHGFINKGQVGTLEGWYIFKDVRIRKRSLRKTEGLSSEQRISQLSVDRHVDHPVSRMSVLSRRRRQVLSPPNQIFDPPNDPSWREMWYMHCGSANTSTYCPSSMRVVDAWRAGYTGEGVVATILDDGIETTHPDLTRNYDPRASKDINENDYDPSPRYDPSNENKHGTRCAGVVAAAMGNRICSVGIAFKAKIGGIRMLDGDVTDKVEAESLNYARDHIDIYSASWGPDDDGATVEGPGSLAKAAFRDGAKYGRGGKGSIFVWASGNGGHNKDSCACDGYINSIYTIGVSSVSQKGQKPWYLEACASTLATTYSSGETNEGKVITTDLHSSCTHQHTGTSASAPMAVGLIALMLEANSELTWRDVQHIIVRTTSSRGLKANDWVENGAGFRVSHVFGFGLMDAAAMTHVASTWQTVPEQKNCVTEMQHLVKQIRPKMPLVVTMDTDACHRQATEVAYLEHVILRINLSHNRRGDLQIFLTSPSGTTSTILERRDFDRTKGGFNKWEFMTTHHWGENPMGVWELKIRDTRPRNRELRHSNFLREWQLIFFGTTTHPQPNFRFDNCDTYPQNLCHPECNGCCGAGNGQCRQCRNLQTLQGECISSCPLNYYAERVEDDAGVRNVCKPCSRVCRKCDGGQPNNCTACHPGFNIVDGTCEKTCSAGFYLTPEPSQTCRRCAEICQTCHKRSTLCTSCRDGFRFHDGDCRPSCPRGTYLISITSGCGLCNKSCESCTSFPYRCTSCADGYVLHRQRCTKECPKRHFPDFTKKICRPCAAPCKACTGPKKNQCTKCMSNRTLREGVCFPSPVCQDAYPVTSDSTNPCRIVLNRNLCYMEIFAKACCASCESGGFAGVPTFFDAYDSDYAYGDYDDYNTDDYNNYEYNTDEDEDARNDYVYGNGNDEVEENNDEDYEPTESNQLGDDDEESDREEQNDD